MNLPNKFYQYPIRCDKKIPNVYTTACKRYGDPRKPTQWMLGHGVPNIYTIVCLSVRLSVSLSQIQFPFIIFRTIIDIELKFGIQLEHYKI